MKQKLILIPVRSIGSTPSIAFADGPNVHGLRTIDMPDYPPSERGENLRELRRQRYMTIREGAKLLGLSVVELSGLEFGKFTMSIDDWDAAERMFPALARKQ